MRKMKEEGKEKGKWPGRFLFFHPVGIRWPFETEVRRRRMITRVDRETRHPTANGESRPSAYIHVIDRERKKIKKINICLIVNRSPLIT